MTKSGKSVQAIAGLPIQSEADRRLLELCVERVKGSKRGLVPIVFDLEHDTATHVEGIAADVARAFGLSREDGESVVVDFALRRHFEKVERGTV